MDAHAVLNLKRIATNIRKGVITAVASAGSGHPGGSLSIADIMAYLFFEKMNIDPKNPKNPDRDRFVMSKGHCSPALYSTLAHRGFFPVEDLSGFRQVSSYLEGHPNMNTVPGVDMSTGSLGQGFSAAVGMGMAGKLDKRLPGICYAGGRRTGGRGGLGGGHVRCPFQTGQSHCLCGL